MRRSVLFPLLPAALILLFGFTCSATGPGADQKPRLIVGIVIDQMRYDYLTRYWDKFGEGGFRKLISEGVNCVNARYNYIPTYTGPGHASIYTGTTPSVHGIVSNNWYDRKSGTVVYVTGDTVVRSVGGSSAGLMSPRNLKTTTFCDEVRLESNMRSKVIGISLKDRGAILPAGFSANAAYWFDGPTGNWITSSWYMDTLPEWVIKFNAKERPREMLQKPWTPLLPLSDYTESTSDDSPYEEPYPGETAPVFPHNFPVIGATNYELIRRSPYGTTLTKEFALAAVKAEQLGMDDFTDVLAVSFSSTDYVGHQFGTNAIETEDTYLRLDRDLAELITAIEAQCGKDQVLFFLTADHGASPNPTFLKDRKIPAGYFVSAGIKDSLEKYLVTRFGKGPYVLAVENNQVYLNETTAGAATPAGAPVREATANWLMQWPGVNYVAINNLLERSSEVGWLSYIRNGSYPGRSGDVSFITEPGLIEWMGKGTTHFSPYAYDTHVPVIFYGAAIRHGVIEKPVHITDIAPTLAALLGIQPPSGCTGQLIEKVIDWKESGK